MPGRETSRIPPTVITPTPSTERSWPATDLRDGRSPSCKYPKRAIVRTTKAKNTRVPAAAEMNRYPKEIANAYAPRKSPPTKFTAVGTREAGPGKATCRAKSIANPLAKRTVDRRYGVARPPTMMYRVITLFAAKATMIDNTAKTRPQRSAIGCP